MRIDGLDFFYLSMPQILDVADGSQDLLLVRLVAGPYVGWGECEASPLTSIASLVCPMSHSACKPVRESVLGQRLDAVDDIASIGRLVRANSMDLLQADHTLSGIDMAMWDLLGKRYDEPVYRLLGYERAYPKVPYASQLFGETPSDTFAKARAARARGYRATKFGWGTFGTGPVRHDEEQVRAAREGLGAEGILLIDAGAVWGEDTQAARERLPVLEECRVTWLEEPFVLGATDAYSALASARGSVKLAGGEGGHNYYVVKHLIDHGRIGYAQIDAGRIGGISQAKRVADYARSQSVVYVNHTFTSHLALSASLQPYAGIQEYALCEYPVEPKALAVEVTCEHMVPDEDGQVRLPEAPGLGMTPHLPAVARYLREVSIVVDDREIYRTPSLT